MLDILIIMNNYFHDVATATLLAAAVILWTLDRQARRQPGDTAILKRAYPKLTAFARIALVWVVLGGIPRVVFFNTHDLGAVRNDLVPAIAVKHVVEVLAVLLGVLLWRRVKRSLDAYTPETPEEPE